MWTVPSQSAGDLRLHRIGERVHLYRGYFSNSVVLLLETGVVVVDTQVSPLAGRRLRAEIAKLTSLPVAVVVNTHYHGDHVGGNAAFPEAEIVMTEACARFVKERDAERIEYAETFGLAFQEVPPVVPPTRTFNGREELRLGRDVLELCQLGRAETPDACVLHWPAQRLVAVGDGVATCDYPYLGVPFLDEGLRDDGEWIGFLDRIRRLKPELLLAGHGPPLVGQRAIAERLDVLERLMGDLLAATKAELDPGVPLAEQLPGVVARVQHRLRRYRSRRDLREHTVSQRFAIYRCVNNLLPQRKGKGWWHDLRPSRIVRASPEELRLERGRLPEGEGRARDLEARAISLARRGRRALAISLLESGAEEAASSPERARLLGLLADVLFDGARGVMPTVDATEYIAAATRAARAALAIDPGERRALLTLGCAEVFGGMVLAQPMAPAFGHIEAALAAPGPPLTAAQHRRAQFFLGKAHQMEQRDADSDRHFRRALPPLFRPLFPLLRARLRSYP